MSDDPSKRTAHETLIKIAEELQALHGEPRKPESTPPVAPKIEPAPKVAQPAAVETVAVPAGAGQTSKQEPIKPGATPSPPASPRYPHPMLPAARVATTPPAAATPAPVTIPTPPASISPPPSIAPIPAPTPSTPSAPAASPAPVQAAAAGATLAAEDIFSRGINDLLAQGGVQPTVPKAESVSPVIVPEQTKVVPGPAHGAPQPTQTPSTQGQGAAAPPPGPPNQTDERPAETWAEPPRVRTPSGISTMMSGIRDAAGQRTRSMLQGIKGMWGGAPLMTYFPMLIAVMSLALSGYQGFLFHESLEIVQRNLTRGEYIRTCRDLIETYFMVKQRVGVLMPMADRNNVAGASRVTENNRLDAQAAVARIGGLGTYLANFQHEPTRARYTDLTHSLTKIVEEARNVPLNDIDKLFAPADRLFNGMNDDCMRLTKVGRM